MSIEYLLAICFILSFIEGIVLIGFFIPSIIILFGLIPLIAYEFLPLVCVLLALGSFLGSMVSFYLGTKVKVLSKKYKQYKKHIYKFMSIAIFAAKFFGPIRGLMPFLAGAYKYNFRLFVFLEIFASSLWSILYTLTTKGIFSLLFSNSYVFLIVVLVGFTILWYVNKLFIKVFKPDLLQ